MISSQVSGPTPITTCPHCSILVDGSCLPCMPGDAHPSCNDCVDGRHKPPWYRSNLVVAVTTAVIVSVASGIIASQLREAIKKTK